MKQKYSIKQIILAFTLLMILSLNSFADVTGGTSIVDNLDPYELGYDFKKDGIYYKILGGDSVSTSEGETPYAGRVVIPDEVTYNNITYKITKVSGFRNSPDVTEVTIPKYTECITRFYGGDAGSWGGPGIKSIEQRGDTVISTLFSNLKKVNFNAINCKKVYYSFQTSTMLGGAYGGHVSIFPFSLENIEFGEDVERIPDGLLYGCSEIKRLVFPKSVKYIGWWIIKENCDEIEYCELQCSDLQEIAWLPKDQNSVKLSSSFQTYPCGKEHSFKEYISGQKEDISIFSSMFHNFVGINVDANGMLVLPKWVKRIAPNAFAKCDFNFNLTIPETITDINEGAFYGCNELEEVVIPTTVTHIGKNAFYGCSNLKTLYYNAENCVADRDVFRSCSSLNNIVFGGNVIRIPDLLFSNCPGIKSLNIPNYIKEVGERAFENAGITEVTIPNSMLILGESAFGSCKNLITLNYNAENCTINSSFSGCNSLSHVVFGDKVTKIPDALLYNCVGLKKITIPNTITEIGKYAFQYSGLTEISIPESITDIGIWAFANCSQLNTVYFNAINCNNINGAFYSCDALTKAVFGDRVTRIPESLFMNCKNLKEIQISESVKEISKYAFYSTGIAELTIPMNVIKIGESPFGNCKDLTTIYYNAQNCAMDNAISSNSLTNIIIGDDVSVLPSYFINDCENITQITIPKNVNIIGGYAFAFCDNLKTIYFDAENSETQAAPNGISNVFWTCFSLENVVVGDNVKTIPNSLFSDCRGLKNIIIPNSVTEIGEWAFASTSISSIIIPNNITKIGNGAFADCLDLNTLYFNAENCEIIPNDVNTRIFNYCNSLSLVEFGESVTKIPVGLLYYCQNLQKVTIPNSVNEIGAHAFNGTKLSEIVIPNSVTKIGDRAFQHCYNLASVTIGTSVQEIGEFAFGTCNNIKTVISLNSTPPNIKENTFSIYTYNNANLNIPENCINLYENSVGWKNFKNVSVTDNAGLDEVIVNPEISPVYYNLQGMKVGNPSKGIYLKLQNNKISKIIID